MAGFDTNLNYGTFDPDMDPTSVGLRFRKYVERFKVYALAMNIKDKARKRELFLHCAGPKVQDIFDTNPEEKLYTLGQQAQSKTAGKVCFFCGGTFPHAGGRMKCPAPGKKCLTCNKMNHFAKCCRMKGKEDRGVLKAVEKDSDSSEAESLCGIEKVGAVEHNQGRRPVSKVTVNFKCWWIQGPL